MKSFYRAEQKNAALFLNLFTELIFIESSVKLIRINIKINDKVQLSRDFESSFFIKNVRDRLLKS